MRTLSADREPSSSYGCAAPLTVSWLHGYTASLQEPAAAYALPMYAKLAVVEQKEERWEQLGPSHEVKGLEVVLQSQLPSEPHVPWPLQPPSHQRGPLQRSPV